MRPCASRAPLRAARTMRIPDDMATTYERRGTERGRRQVVFDLFFPLLRATFGRVHSAWTALGIVLGIGIIVLAIATWGFVTIARSVAEGDTQAFDESVLRWINQYNTPLVERLMIEITMLGTWIVVFAVAGISGLFLLLTHHRFSALLLLVATAGGILLNSVLKLAFDRPRPEVFEWGTHVASSSFPSGHATSAAAVYGSVAYLAARLHKRHWARWLSMSIFLLIIFLICFSRLYLGVHYPSDVAAGAIFGLGWAAFVMLTLEGVQRFAKRNAKELVEDEEPSPKQEEEEAEAQGGVAGPPAHAATGD